MHLWLQQIELALRQDPVSLECALRHFAAATEVPQLTDFLAEIEYTSL